MTNNPLPLRVLIADDSAAIRRRLAAMLAEIPNAVVCGEAAAVPSSIATIRGLRPDVVILDLSMPGGSGLDVLTQIRREHIPAVVIVLTNYALPEYESRARSGGADAFLDKAHEFQKAIALVRELSERNHRNKDSQ